MSRIVAAKAVAALALTLGAGGVAVAATTDTFRAGPLAGATGQHSAPANTPRTLAVDPASGSRPRSAGSAEPAPTDPPTRPSPDERPDSCAAGDDRKCATPKTTGSPSSPNRSATTPAGRRWTASHDEHVGGQHRHAAAPAPTTSEEPAKKPPPAKAGKGQPTTKQT